MSSLGTIEKEDPSFCQLCGKYEETRPYGPKGEEVCVDCGMKDKEAVARGFLQYVCGLSPEEARKKQLADKLDKREK